jgi:hypothetical protein
MFDSISFIFFKLYVTPNIFDFNIAFRSYPAKRFDNILLAEDIIKKRSVYKNILVHTF